MARQCQLSTYLSKSILSNGLESLFHVDRFLGAGLKVGDLVFGLTPLLRTPGGHGAVVKIYFVSEDNKGEVVGVSGTGLDIKVLKVVVTERREQFAWIRNSSLQLSSDLKVLGAVTS